LVSDINSTCPMRHNAKQRAKQRAKHDPPKRRRAIARTHLRDSDRLSTLRSLARGDRIESVSRHWRRAWRHRLAGAAMRSLPARHPHTLRLPHHPWIAGQGRWPLPAPRPAARYSWPPSPSCIASAARFLGHPALAEPFVRLADVVRSGHTILPETVRWSRRIPSGAWWRRKRRPKGKMHLGGHKKKAAGCILTRNRESKMEIPVKN